MLYEGLSARNPPVFWRWTKRRTLVREDIDFLDSTLIITQRRLFLKTQLAEVLLVIDFGKRFGGLRRRRFQRQKTNVLFRTYNRTDLESCDSTSWTVCLLFVSGTDDGVERRNVFQKQLLTILSTRCVFKNNLRCDVHWRRQFHRRPTDGHDFPLALFSRRKLQKSK